MRLSEVESCTPIWRNKLRLRHCRRLGKPAVVISKHYRSAGDVVRRVALGFVISSLGVGHRQQRREALSWLLEAEDLPGWRWALISQRTYRSGVGGKSDMAKRARQTGAMAAVRTFRLRQSLTARSVTIWLWPFASSADAEEALPGFAKRPIRNPNSLVTPVSRREVHDVEVNDVNHPWVYEVLTRGPSGQASEKWIGGTVDEVVFIVQAVERAGSGWPWNDVAEVARTQSRKLRRAS
jgi:hypothetical protein